MRIFNAAVADHRNQVRGCDDDKRVVGPNRHIAVYMAGPLHPR